MRFSARWAVRREVTASSAHRALARELLLFRSLLGRQSGREPAVPAAQERGRVLHSMSIEVQHRTGACVLALSSTVGDDLLARRKLFDPDEDLAQRNAERTFDVALVILILTAYIDPDGLAFLDLLD